MITAMIDDKKQGNAVRARVETSVAVSAENGRHTEQEPLNP
jgi:hypothetical protein